MIITPVVYANQTAINLSDSALSIAWKRKDGSAAEANLAAGEAVAGNVLTISKLVTYIAYS